MILVRIGLGVALPCTSSAAVVVVVSFIVCSIGRPPVLYMDLLRRCAGVNPNPLLLLLFLVVVVVVAATCHSLQLHCRFSSYVFLYQTLVQTPNILPILCIKTIIQDGCKRSLADGAQHRRGCRRRRPFLYTLRTLQIFGLK